MKTIQELIDAARAEKQERKFHHKLILDKEKQVEQLEKEIKELRQNSMEGYELKAITDLINQIHDK